MAVVRWPLPFLLLIVFSTLPMHLCRRDSRDVISVPVEIFELILQHTDRSTRIELRFTCRLVRDLATPLVFDKLYADVKPNPPRADHDLVSFKRLWINRVHSEPRVLDTSRVLLRPMVRSITVGTDAIHVNHVQSLLKSCPNVSELGLIVHGTEKSTVARVVKTMSLALSSQQIRCVTLFGDIERVILHLQEIPKMSVGHLSILPHYHPHSNKRYPLAWLLDLEQQHAPMLTSLTIDLSELDGANFMETRAPHQPYNENHANNCRYCTHPLPSVERVSIGVPATLHYPRAKFIRLITYVCIKFPRTRALELHTSRYQEYPRPRVLHNENLLGQPLEYLPSLELVEIHHPAVNDILSVLQDYNLIAPSATHRRTPATVIASTF
ncbi:hypothetical protein BC940DRAFT_319011 [Gongronella butleri]|nr:hypothetical protein BC940DRAFT_319011 [Gongronella butleri]